MKTAQLGLLIQEDSAKGPVVLKDVQPPPHTLQLVYPKAAKAIGSKVEGCQHLCVVSERCFREASTSTCEATWRQLVTAEELQASPTRFEAKITCSKTHHRQQTTRCLGVGRFKCTLTKYGPLRLCCPLERKNKTATLYDEFWNSTPHT